MENTNANDFNAGATGDQGAGADLGTGANNGSQPSGNPGDQQGQGSDERDSKIAELSKNNAALNKALVEARRAGNQNPQRQQNADGQQDPNDPAVQYGNAIVVAEGDLRSKLEPVLELYPELTEADKAQIRRNPWAFVDRSNFLSLNVANSLIDIEEHIAKIAEGQSTVKQEQNANGGNGSQQTTPARVNQNPASDGQQGDGQSNPMEDWSLPMDQLEAKVNKIKSANAAKS